MYGYVCEVWGGGVSADCVWCCSGLVVYMAERNEIETNDLDNIFHSHSDIPF